MGTERPDAFPVTVEWEGRRLTRARTAGGRSMEVATPPMFPEGMDGYWSPEDMLAGAVGSCLLLTFVAACCARDIPLHDVRVTAVARAGKRVHGGYGFQGVDVTFVVEAGRQWFERIEPLIQRAERNCIVATALEVPIEIELELRATDAQVVVV